MVVHTFNAINGEAKKRGVGNQGQTRIIMKPSQERGFSAAMAESSIGACKTLGSIPHTSKKNLKTMSNSINSAMPVAAFHLQEMDSPLKGILASEEGQNMANFDVMAKSS